MRRCCLLALLAACLPGLLDWTATRAAPTAASGQAGEDGWTDLTRLDAWRGKTGGWQVVGDASLRADNPRQLDGKPGTGVLLNGPKGRAPDLLSKQAHGDVELHAEFLIARGSNSGVKFEGLYEIQILDSWGKKKLTGNDCGGIYPRARLSPRYEYLDQGVPPRVNACKKPGEWQVLDVIFQAPRFDAKGKRTAKARVVRAVLNGQLIHENVELNWPTGHNWQKAEVATGPLLLQGDHGPVAFRNVRVRPYRAPAKKE